ncbi:TlpA family protein disulfide reductase [Corynebacterium bovis]|uniref:TlpA family protein disulfide reductase n=1 Tax=Corynebacterium bovis TaxID=36808 RepID=UPI0031393421
MSGRDGGRGPADDGVTAAHAADGAGGGAGATAMTDADGASPVTDAGASRADRLRLPLLVAVVVVGLLIAAVPVVVSLTAVPSAPPAPALTTTPGDPAAAGVAGPGAGGPDGAPADPEGTTYRVPAARRAACPVSAGGTSGTGTGGGAAPDAVLAGVRLPCLTTGGGEDVDLVDALAGKPTVLNVWAWWCAPCREELPVIREAAQRHPEWNVVGVHLDGRGQAGLDMLDDLGVTVPSYQDSRSAVAAAAELPAVVPVTLVLRPDGTRAALHAGPFADLADLEAAVTGALG